MTRADEVLALMKRRGGDADVGHLLHDLGETAADEGIDTRHEVAGCEWLLSRYGADVAEPMRLRCGAGTTSRRSPA